MFLLIVKSALEFIGQTLNSGRLESVEEQKCGKDPLVGLFKVGSSQMFWKFIQQITSQLILKIANSAVHLPYVVVNVILKLHWYLTIVSLHHPIEHCQFCVQDVVFFSYLTNQVTNLGNVVPKQDATEHLQKCGDDDFVLAVGQNISKANCHHDGCSPVKGIKVANMPLSITYA